MAVVLAVLVADAGGAEGMSFYLAGRFERREELRGYALRLRELGHDVTSRWLDNHGLSAQLDPKFGEEDITDVMASTAFIQFSENPTTAFCRGGRHVELGIAIAMAATRRTYPVYIVGPVETVFHATRCITGIFDDWL